MAQGTPYPLSLWISRSSLLGSPLLSAHLTPSTYPGSPFLTSPTPWPARSVPLLPVSNFFALLKKIHVISVLGWRQSGGAYETITCFSYPSCFSLMSCSGLLSQPPTHQGRLVLSLKTNQDTPPGSLPMPSSIFSDFHTLPHRVHCIFLHTTLLLRCCVHFSSLKWYNRSLHGQAILSAPAATGSSACGMNCECFLPADRCVPTCQRTCVDAHLYVDGHEHGHEQNVCPASRDWHGCSGCLQLTLTMMAQCLIVPIIKYFQNLPWTWTCAWTSTRLHMCTWVFDDQPPDNGPHLELVIACWPPFFHSSPLVAHKQESIASFSLYFFSIIATRWCSDAPLVTM